MNLFGELAASRMLGDAAALLVGTVLLARACHLPIDCMLDLLR